MVDSFHGSLFPFSYSLHLNCQEGKPPYRTPLEQELQAVHSTGMTLAVFLRFIRS